MTARRWQLVPEPAKRERGAVYISGASPREAYEEATAVYVSGVRFARQPLCRLEMVDEGRPCSTYRCSACGKLHTASRAQAFCPRCGARNSEPDRHDANSNHREDGGSRDGA